VIPTGPNVARLISARMARIETTRSAESSNPLLHAVEFADAAITAMRGVSGKNPYKRASDEAIAAAILGYVDSRSETM
jgi:hypothetical protein